MPLRDEILDLIRTDPAFREEVRRQILTDEILGLPALVRELAAEVRELAAAQRRTEERIERLAEAIRHQGEQIRLQGEQIRLQGEHLERLSEEVAALVRWQRGEAGRRDGERYERELVRQAPALFNGGEGGAPEEPTVRRRLTEQLRARLAEGLLGAEENPFLADLVWWKGEQVAVVEASVQVNGSDIARAAARAATLARAGAPALAVVIGEEWAMPQAARDAEGLRVEWKVGSDLSAGFLALRRRPG
jgi:hypothetical protein